MIKINSVLNGFTISSVKLIGVTGESADIPLAMPTHINPGDTLQVHLPPILMATPGKVTKEEVEWSKELPKKSGWYVGTNQEVITYTTTHRVINKSKGYKSWTYKAQQRVIQPHQLFPIRIDISSTVKPARLSMNFFNLMSPQIRLPTLSSHYASAKDDWENKPHYKSIVIRQIPLIPNAYEMLDAAMPDDYGIKEDDDILI